MTPQEYSSDKINQYKFSKDGYMLEFTIVYSEYDETERMLKRQVYEYQIYTDVKNHIDALFSRGIHEVTIGCRPSRMTREQLYDMLWNHYQDMLQESMRDEEDRDYDELYL
jgi:hypothetical protein